MTVLITGGAGYIGSHTARAMLESGRPVLIIDDLSRGHAAAIDRLRTLPGAGERLSFIQCGLADRECLSALLVERGVSVVMHFAAYAYVGESVQKPLLYYRNNVAGTLALLEACRGSGVHTFVLSSSCATYGEPDGSQVPISENCPQQPVNPYGWSKLIAERMVLDEVQARGMRGETFRAGILRYFNVAGCDAKGLLGVDHDPETRIIPIILRTLLGQHETVSIYGTDYPTPDGTCIRDYIHPDDLAHAHVAVMAHLESGEANATCTYNLGIGRGYSVREVIEAVERVTGRTVPVREEPRRPGDPPVLSADVSKIARELGWRAEIDEIERIIETMWGWFGRNPTGYRG